MFFCIEMKIFDNHVHLRPSTVDFFFGAFSKAGGTSLNLVNLTEECMTVEQFEGVYRETISISKSLRERGLEVVVSIGPYPVNYIEMRKKVGKEEALKTYKKATDIAIGLIEAGSANAIGEVGRPHFETSNEVVEESNSIMEYIFQSTADRDIPVILHTESLDAEGMCKIEKLASKNGKVSHVVKHFSGAIFADNCGIIPSFPANRKNARAAPWGDDGFFMETDFAGDETNPNFVLPPDSVPKRITMLLQEGIDKDKIERSMNYFRTFYLL